MDRVKNLVLGSAAAAYAASDSPLASDYNWNDLSIGNDTITCDRFFRAANLENQQAINEINRNMNNIQIIFEDTVDSENNSNFLNCSVDSRPRTSPAKLQEEEAARPDDNDNDSGNGASNCESPIANSLVDKSHPKAKPKPKPLRNHVTNKPNVPNAVFAGQVYELKRKQRMQQLERTERDQRKFHAKKVPNFNLIHAATGAKQAAEEPKPLTVAVTPKVVHHHRKNLERVRAKLQEEEAARQPKPFVAREPEVLSQQPFTTQQSRKPPTEPMPFNLHSEERVHERHQYNEQYKKELERREREQEERRKAEDEHIRKEIRKGTTFKAKPNPFA